MKKLLVMDQKNYNDTMPVDERFGVRAVIFRNGKIAVQKSRYGDYKLLGGGIEKGEDVITALCREVEEESGLILRRDSIREVGEILEKRKDLYQADRVYLNHTWYYICEAEQEIGRVHMTPSEIARGYHLAWATPEQIIAGNGNFLYQPWILRDTRFVQIFVNGII